MPAANVLSIPALRDFRASLATFHDEARGSIESMLLDLLRITAWIDEDRPAYWDTQLKRAFDQVAATRTALSTCQMRTVVGRRPSCIEEKQNYQKAKNRLQRCQEQVQHVRQWRVKLQREVDEFRARIAGSQRMLMAEIPQMAAMLDAMSGALEDYAGITAPPAPDMGEPAT